MLVAGLAGLILGWAWLTREEGVWFLPGLGLLAAGAVLIHCKESRELLALARNLCIAAVTFIAVNATFMTGNRIAYGSFVGVGFKENNFKSALDALEDVDAGPVIPHVPVPLSARTEVAKISPTFAPISIALAPGGRSFGWSNIGCQIYKDTCDDIAGGWFVWALREAASLNNFYQSPKMAAENFGKIANEIAAACSDGRLHCHRRWVSYMPRLNGQQWRSLPSSLFAVAGKVSFLNAPIPVAANLSSVRTTDFERYWSFLNYPDIFPVDQNGGHAISFVNPGEKLAANIRAGLVRFYKILVPLLLLAGLIAAAAASWRAVRARTLDAMLATALAAWALVATRIVILALIDVSSFPAAHLSYSSPANNMVIVAVFLSIAALIVKPRPA